MLGTILKNSWCRRPHISRSTVFPQADPASTSAVLEYPPRTYQTFFLVADLRPARPEIQIESIQLDPAMLVRIHYSTQLAVTPKDSESLRHPFCLQYDVCHMQNARDPRHVWQKSLQYQSGCRSDSLSLGGTSRTPALPYIHITALAAPATHGHTCLRVGCW